jgi:hypothetical protein
MPVIMPASRPAKVGFLSEPGAGSRPSAGADAEVPGAVNVALPGGKLLVPDVVVAAGEAAGEMATGVPCDAVLAVVEVAPRADGVDGPGCQAGHVCGSGHPRAGPAGQ